jgi:selenocysteine-specific translation elongation factor
VHLAISPNFRDVRAVILLSPIASGVRLVSPETQLADLEKVDVFCNIKKIIDVSCPIFLIHGHKDEVIPIEQSIEMSKFMKNIYLWLPRNGDHGNILTKYRVKFFQKCKFFLEFLNDYAKKNIDNNNSVTTYNYADNEKYCQYFMNEKKNKNKFPHIVVQDSYIQKEFDEMNNFKGQAFSNKDRYKSMDSFGSFEDDKKVEKNKLRYHNPLNSQIKDYPFDLLSNCYK